MNKAEFLEIAGLVALRFPEDPRERDAMLQARLMLRVFASRVHGDDAPASGEAVGGEAADAPVPCRLRADDPQDGLADDAVFALAPEHGDRLVLVPRVL